MRKLAIAVVVLLGLAAAATPLAGGLLARRAHARLVEDPGVVERSTLGLVRIVEQDFALGWLRSSARSRIEIGLPGNAWAFTLLHRIHHGPVPLGRIARTPWLAVIQTVEEGGRLRGETRVDLQGDWGSDLVSPPLPGGGASTWEGASLRARGTDQGQHIDIALSAPRLELRGDGRDLAVASASATYGIEAVQGGFLHTLKASLASARIASAEGDTGTAIENVAWSSTATTRAERVSVQGDFSLGGLELEGGRYTGARFHVELHDADASALAALDALWRTAQSVLDGRPLPQLADALWANLLASLPALVASTARIELGAAHVETPDGGIDLDLEMRFDGADATRAIEILQLQGRVTLPPPAFAALMQVTAALAAPGAAQANDAATLAYLASGLADELVRKRYVFQDSDGRLSADLAYVRGQLSLNGAALDLGALFGQATQDQVH